MYKSRWRLIISTLLLGLLPATATAARDSFESPAHHTSTNSPSSQFMTIPLSRDWLTKNNIAYEISEGWNYTWWEQQIHGLVSHWSVDYAVPYGTPVYAPVNGYIHASYLNTTLGMPGRRRLYQGQPVNYGLGYRAQIIYPDPSDPLNPNKITFIQLAHLSRFSSKLAATIEWLPYVYSAWEDAVKINNYSLSTTDLEPVLRWEEHSGIIPIKRWELIGYVGTSGLEQWEEIVSGYTPTMYPDNPYHSRDEPHVHIQIYRRRAWGGRNAASITDPYNLRWSAESYPTHSNWLTLTLWHMFKTTDGKLPDYAK